MKSSRLYVKFLNVNWKVNKIVCHRHTDGIALYHYIHPRLLKAPTEENTAHIS